MEYDFNDDLLTIDEKWIIFNIVEDWNEIYYNKIFIKHILKNFSNEIR